MSLIIHTSRVTRHARRHLAQRGIFPDALKLLMAWGHDLPAGGGCVRWTLLVTDAAELLAEDVPLALVEAALRLETVVDKADDVVTVYARSATTLGLGSRRSHGRPDHRRGRRILGAMLKAGGILHIFLTR